MAKDPAFLFYPNDWLGGTLGMTFEEKGAYMELLMLQFNRGHMTTHMIGQVVGQNWDKLKDKFVQDDIGLWYNERLEEEKIKRQNFTKSRRNNVSGHNQHTKKKNISDTYDRSYDQNMTTHMENENENVNENRNINKRGGFFKIEDFSELPEQYTRSIIEQMKIQKQKDIEKSVVISMWEIFKTQNLTGDKFYNTSNEVYRHFTNWIKTQKFEQNGKPANEKRFEAYLEYANRYKDVSNDKNDFGL